MCLHLVYGRDYLISIVESLPYDIVFGLIKLEIGNIRWQVTKKFKSEKAHKAIEEAELELGLLLFPMAILVG